MNRILIGLSLLGVVFALLFVFGTSAQADQTNVGRDLGIFTMGDANYFGDDQALNSATGGDRDADSRSLKWTPDTYGIKGTYGYYSNGAG